MDKEQILIKANILEGWMERCFITDSGEIFTPRLNSKTSTGTETYAKYLEDKGA